ncbi:hypothetical protein HanLR1_Chr08g0262781 [Helianthus annuus]|nr:hypothetical protein HanLR1_Chr08g0262781 [Helianthus annuus]
MHHAIVLFALLLYLALALGPASKCLCGVFVLDTCFASQLFHISLSLHHKLNFFWSIVDRFIRNHVKMILIFMLFACLLGYDQVFWQSTMVSLNMVILISMLFVRLLGYWVLILTFESDRFLKIYKVFRSLIIVRLWLGLLGLSFLDCYFEGLK